MWTAWVWQSVLGVAMACWWATAVAQPPPPVPTVEISTTNSTTSSPTTHGSPLNYLSPQPPAIPQADPTLKPLLLIPLVGLCLAFPLALRWRHRQSKSLSIKEKAR